MIKDGFAELIICTNSGVRCFRYRHHLVNVTQLGIATQVTRRAFATAGLTVVPGGTTRISSGLGGSSPPKRFGTFSPPPSIRRSESPLPHP